MDDIDRAQEAEAKFRTLAIQAATGSRGRQSATECVECGAPIPEARQKAVPGCRLCVECQAEAEKR